MWLAAPMTVSSTPFSVMRISASGSVREAGRTGLPPIVGNVMSIQLRPASTPWSTTEPGVGSAVDCVGDVTASASVSALERLPRRSAKLPATKAIVYAPAARPAGSA